MENSNTEMVQAAPEDRIANALEDKAAPTPTKEPESRSLTLEQSAYAIERAGYGSDKPVEKTSQSVSESVSESPSAHHELQQNKAIFVDRWSAVDLTKLSPEEGELVIQQMHAEYAQLQQMESVAWVLDKGREYLYAHAPHLSDHRKPEAINNILHTAEEFGFSKDEVRDCLDPRLILMVDALANQHLRKPKPARKRRNNAVPTPQQVVNKAKRNNMRPAGEEFAAERIDRMMKAGGA